jgi:thioredoxin-dependent peroxiredoxin
MDTRSRWAGFLILTAAVVWALPAHAQAAADTTSPAVGAEAPDFSLPGATRYGLLKDPVRLSDYRGQTVVLAFFFKARTKG